MTEPGIIKSTELAKLLRISLSTLHEWLGELPEFKACRIRSTKRSTWFSVTRLRDAGYLTNAPVEIGTP